MFHLMEKGYEMMERNRKKRLTFSQISFRILNIQIIAHSLDADALATMNFPASADSMPLTASLDEFSSVSNGCDESALLGWPYA